MSSEGLLADIQPHICAIPSREAFDGLDEEDRIYAHFMCRASFLGTRIVLRQTSEEAEHIFDLLIGLYQSVDGDWEKLIVAQATSRADLSLFLDFAAMFLANLGNYRSQGDTKFVPRLDRKSFEQLCRYTPRTHSQFLEVADKLFATTPNRLGYPNDENAASGYYLGSARTTKEDISTIQHALQSHGILPENTRVIKKSESADNCLTEQYTLLLASSIASPSSAARSLPLDLPGSPRIDIEGGDHGSVLRLVVSELKSAKEHTTKPLRKEMIGHLIEAFSTGDHSKFKEAQKAWVRDINPSVEVIIGFIETYQDPHGIRGAWEGIVAVVNKSRSQKFSTLVENSSQLITTLPWNSSKVGLPSNQKSAFEPAGFIMPNFTSLDTIGFVKSESPAGINLPNFEDICQEHGSKNLEFGNVNNTNPTEDKIPFIQTHEVPFLRKLRERAFEVAVACHELLGHGSGQLFVESEPGVYNFDIQDPPANPITQMPISTWYKPGQTWSNVFGAHANAIEECRADGVALVLMTHKPVLQIFRYTDTSDITADDITYAGWLHFVHGAITGFTSWNPQTRKWGQSHRRGQYALLRCMMKSTDSFLKIERTSDDLTILMNREKIITDAVPSIQNFLLHLQVYKSTANVEEGVRYFEKFSEVDKAFEECRNIVLRKAPARIQYVQANTFLEGGRVRLQEYPSTREGLIQSWAERHV